MSDIVGMGGPISFHLGEEVSLEDPLCFADGRFDRVGSLRVQLAVIIPVKHVQGGRN